MPTIAQVANAAIPAGVDLATWLNSRNGLNGATSTINAGATQAGQQIDAATATALQAQKDASAKQQGLYDTTVTNNQPYQDQGKLSLAQLQKLGTNTFDPSSVATDPGYQFGMSEGLKGGDRAAAARGTTGNGGQVRAQTRYALDYATTKYNDAFDRFLQSQQSGLSIAQAGINAGQHSNDEVQTAGTTLGNQDQTNATTQGTFGVNGAEDKASLTLAQAELAARNQSAQTANTNNALSTIPGIAQKSIGLLTQNPNPNPFPPATLPNGLPNPAANPQAPFGSDPAALSDPYSSSPQGIGPNAGNPAATIAELSSAGAGAATAVGVGSGAAAAATPAVSVVIPGVTDAAVGSAAAAGGAGVAGAGAEAGTEAAVASGEVSSGALSSVAGFLTNPVTIGLGLALGAALIWRATQVHQTANKWTEGTQTEFGKNLSSIVDGFDQAYAAGGLTKAQAQDARNHTAQLIADVEQKAADFQKQNGSKGKTVINQFHAEMLKDFGPGYSGILAKMDKEISALPETAAA